MSVLLIQGRSVLALRALKPNRVVCTPHRQLTTCRAVMALPSADELRGQSCSLLGGCSSDTPSIPSEQLPSYLSALPAWQLSEDSKSIRRRFVAKNFVAAIDFFNAVKEVAEAEGHHPDLHLMNYREVQVVLSTHAIKALSLLDMVMAAKIDALPVQYSPKWERENRAKLGQA